MNTCQFNGGVRAVTISEWIPTMFWTGSCFQLAFPLLSNSLLEILHRSKASSHYWFLKLVPFGTSCTSADFYKQGIFQSFVEIWKECPIPHCLYLENKYTAVFSSTWQYKVFACSGADSGFLYMILGAGFLSCFSLLPDGIPVLKQSETWVVRLIYFFVEILMKWNRHKPKVSIIRRLIFGSDIFI